MDVLKILEGDFSEVTEMENRTYWFIRTDRGDYFDVYYANGFIAVGWNEITLNDLRNIDVYSGAVRQKIRNNPNNGINNIADSSKQEAKITTILNKCRNFAELSSGDVVIMPSWGSFELAFGIIEDEPIYSSSDGLCEHHKRRKVDWIRREETDTLDAKFAYIKKTFHAISKIHQDYHDIIDNYMFDSYLKNGYGNISLKLKTRDEINYFELKALLDNLIAIAEAHNRFRNLTEDFSQTTIKLNLQSPGFVNLKSRGRDLIFAVALLMASCSDDPVLNNKADEILQVEQIDEDKFNEAKRILNDNQE